ncbi:MAG: hypothetical protein QOG34_925 [Frankiaceae bacterium]|nr:hypothetical protein [Frankiaceae bacterium]
MRRTAVVVALLVGALVTTTSPALAADTTPPQVLDLKITPSTLHLDGLAYTKVVVSVHLQDDSGICAGASNSDCNVDVDNMAAFYGYPTPLVWLKAPVPAPGTFLETSFNGMRLTSGTATDGWWSMTRIATGLWNGTLPAIRIAAFDTAGNKTDIDPRNTAFARSLTVSVTNQPHISYGTVPSVLPYGANSFTVKGRASLLGSGAPLGNRTLLLCQDTGCGIEGSFGGVAVRTNANGYYSVTTTRQALGLMLFKALGSSGGNAYPTTFYSNPLYASRSVAVPRSAHFLTLKTISPSTTVTAGSPVTLKGTTSMFYDTSTPLAWRSISVQRLVSGTWANGTIVTEQTALIEKTTVQAGIHTYTLVAHPPKGTWSYRVYRTATPGYAPTARYLTLAGR